MRQCDNGMGISKQTERKYKTLGNRLTSICKCTQSREVALNPIDRLTNNIVLEKLFIYMGKKIRVPLLSTWSFPDSSVGRESACNVGDLGSLPGSGRSAREQTGYPCQYSWASPVTQVVRIHLQCGRPRFDPWVRKIA